MCEESCHHPTAIGTLQREAWSHSQGRIESPEARRRARVDAVTQVDAVTRVDGATRPEGGPEWETG